MKLRPYQQSASDAVIEHVKQSLAPCLIEAATGAGKSLLVSDIARRIHDMTGKRILALAPSAELVTQNAQKYADAGLKASIYSASAGQKSLRYPVVFGSPLTVKNRIGAFRDGYAMVILDEAHGITPTVRGIIDEMRDGNPYLRVVGMTATPYRLNDGYIFREWDDGKVNGEAFASDPYFAKMVYRITAPSLIEQGYLTPPVIGETGAEGYDTSGLTLNSRGQFDAADVDRAYHGHGRKTAAIVADVIERSRGRRGVMLFAATVQHAKEIMASLPPELSAMVTGETPKAERDRIIREFKAQRIKYIVNVAVLLVGFDAPHVDVLAILRRTESVGLLQQLIGRGLRLFDGKENCLVLDYTENIDTHCPDGDLFAPVVRAKTVKEGEAEPIEVHCPDCGSINMFTRHPDAEGFTLDKHGYCLDLDGERIETEFGPMPGHWGRRCGHVDNRGVRCEYRWTSKPCPQCDAPNDIAARYCCECKAEIVDPNEKLVADLKAMKKDPTQIQTDEVISVDFHDTLSARGNRTIRAEWNTPYRRFTTWHNPEPKFPRQERDWMLFNEATNGGKDAPETISYKKDAESGFYRVISYNREPDVEPEQPALSRIRKPAMAG